jgi:hypothetical protein
MANVVFQSGSTWRKLGYALYTDSLAYREVLNQNPQWSVIENPPIGTVLRNNGNTPGSSGGYAGLSQQSPITPRPSGATTLDYFPFDNQAEYLSAALKYSPSALRDVERLNGWSANSVISDTGVQG